MKIGIASDDHVNIAQHFGRTRGFIISEIKDGVIAENEYRENTFSHHAKTGGDDHSQGHGHSHDAILKALSDCEVVISRGMGRRIYDDLCGANIQAVITTIPTVDAALQAFLNGNLDNDPEKGCEH